MFFTLTRSAPHFLGLYSFEDANTVTLKAPNPANDQVFVMNDGDYISLDLTDSGGFTIESTGLLSAYIFTRK